MKGLEDLYERIGRAAHGVGGGVANVAAKAYDASGLGNIGHALNQSAVALARAPADVVGGVKGAYGAAGSKLQGAADNLGAVTVGAAETTGFVVKQAPAAIRDLTIPVGQGVGAIGQGVGNLGSGAGNALSGVGQGVANTGGGLESFGKYAGFGIGAVAVVLAVVLVVSFARRGARGVAA